MVSSFRLWQWDPSGRFSRESGIFSARWLSEGSALPGKGGRQSLNNSGQSQESCCDGLWFQTSRYDSNEQPAGSAIVGRTPVRWAFVSSFRQGGCSGQRRREKIISKVSSNSQKHWPKIVTAKPNLQSTGAFHKQSFVTQGTPKTSVFLCYPPSPTCAPSPPPHTHMSLRKNNRCPS